MPCYHPISAWFDKDGKNQRGKKRLVFAEHLGEGLPIKIPCGRCIGCRLEKSRQWAIRCVHEAELYDNNFFATLTYDDEKLEQKCVCKDGYTLNKQEFVLFMKRLRKKYGEGIRFFHCGEYGEQTGRPHHHVCLFNFCPDDLKYWKNTSGGKLYTSETVTEKWGNGYVVLGDVTFESAAYVARYVTKKITGCKANEYYGDRVPEYATMSRKGGIGIQWLEKNRKYVIDHDKITMRGGVHMRPPRFYDQKNDEMYPDEMEVHKLIRQMHFDRSKNTPRRLSEKKEIVESKQRLFAKRKI